MDEYTGLLTINNGSFELITSEKVVQKLKEATEQIGQVSGTINDISAVLIRTSNALSDFLDEYTKSVGSPELSEKALKRLIKYSKTPMERKQYEKELNKLYKSRKRKGNKNGQD